MPAVVDGGGGHPDRTRVSAAPTTTAPTSTAGQPAYPMSPPTLANPATVGSPCDFATAVVGSHWPKVANRHSR